MYIFISIIIKILNYKLVINLNAKIWKHKYIFELTNMFIL